jgi:hypothetical protein
MVPARLLFAGTIFYALTSVQVTYSQGRMQHDCSGAGPHCISLLTQLKEIAKFAGLELEIADPTQQTNGNEIKT